MISAKINGIAFTADRWPPAGDRPTVVFIHGSGGSNVLWQHQVDALDGINAVALDLPGHGESDGTGWHRIEDYAREVADFIEASALPRPIPCGLSIGGAIALQLLLDHPESFPAGILCCTGARLRVLPAILETIETDYERFVADLGRFGAAAATDPRRLEPIVDATRRCPPAVTLNDFRACDRFDAMSRLGEIFRPVLVVSGAEDQLTPPKYADYLERHIFEAERTHIADAGHLLPLEQPGALNAAIVRFIRGLVFAG